MRGSLPPGVASEGGGAAILRAFRREKDRYLVGVDEPWTPLDPLESLPWANLYTKFEVTRHD